MVGYDIIAFMFACGDDSVLSDDLVRRWFLKAWLAVRKAEEAAQEAGVAAPPATGVWKFNKNTQAWLLRHAFSEDQVGCFLSFISCKPAQSMLGRGGVGV